MDTNLSSRGERLRAERRRLGLNSADMAAVGGVSPNSQINYEGDKRGAPDANYLAALAEKGVDVAFVVTGQRSGNALPEEERRLLDLFRKADDREQAMILRMVAAATGSAEEASAKASQLLPEEVILKGMFAALLKAVDLSEGKDAIAAYLAESLPVSLEVAEMDWEVRHDANEQQDDPHDELPARKRA